MAINLLAFFKLEDSNPISYRVRLDTSQISQLLKQKSDSEGTEFFVKKFPIRFSSNNEFALSRLSNRNVWRRQLKAKIQEKNGVSEISGKFEMPRFVIAFTLIWIALTTLMSTLLLLNAGFSGNGFVLGLPLFGFLVPYLGRYTSLKDEKAVVQFLEEALGGWID